MTRDTILWGRARRAAALVQPLLDKMKEGA